jgi:High potential iron-sulfur protein
MQKSLVSPMVSRREALRGLAIAAGVVAALPCRQAFSVAPQGAQAPGAAAPHLDVKDPAAVAVGYVESAAKVDPKKYPTYSQGSNCENCLQLQGAAGAGYRPCTLFPGKLVAAAGWCSAWEAEI